MKAEEVKKISDLSRTKISTKEIKEFTEQLSSILGYVNKVQDYEFVSEEYNLNDQIVKLREDKVNPEESEEIIKQFSDKSGKLLKVKKIL